jgi:hypothetical protein
MPEQAAGKTEDVERPHELLYGFTYSASGPNIYAPLTPKAFARASLNFLAAGADLPRHYRRNGRS